VYGSGGKEGVAEADLVVVNGGFGSDGLLGVLLGNGDGTFQTAISYGSGGFQATSVEVADVNGDGKLDLIVANVCPAGGCIEISGGAVGVLLGNGDGTFQTAAVYGGGSIIGAGGNSIVVADVNADGKPDLVLANDCLGDCLHGIVSVQFGNGNGTFQAETVLFSAGLTRFVAVADVNWDGKLDLVVGIGCSSEIANPCLDHNGEIGILFGNGDGTFQTALDYGSGAEDVLAVAVADVNGDGKPDVLVTTGGEVGVLLGNGDGTFQTGGVI
jgi:FG-GAP-like repeat